MPADVRHLAVEEGDVARAVERDGGGDSGFRLAVGVAIGRQHILAMLEGESLKRQVLDELAVGRVAGDLDETVGDRRDDLRRVHVLARQGPVGQRAVAGQEPFARFVQRGGKFSI